MSERTWVTSAVVAAAKLKIKRERARGLPVDEAVQAIADARPAPSRRGEGRTG